jgi:hypothetical protein
MRDALFNDGHFQGDLFMSYQRLFDPPSQDDLEYLPDPMGRLNMGSYVEKTEAMPEPGWETARTDWMNGAPLGEIFGDKLFDLQAGVGADQPNRRGDVFKLQALLHRGGFLDSAATEGPTGYWGGRDDYALRNFQKENGLSIDGFAAPDGETMGTIRGFYKPSPGIRTPEFRTMEKRESDPEPVLRPIGLGSDRPVKPTLLSSDPARNDFAAATGIQPAQDGVPERPAGEQYAQAQQPGALRDVSPEAPVKTRIWQEERAPSPAAADPAQQQVWLADQKTLTDKLATAKAGDGFIRSSSSPGSKECVALVQDVRRDQDLAGRGEDQRRRRSATAVWYGNRHFQGWKIRKQKHRQPCRHLPALWRGGRPEGHLGARPVA